MVEPLSKGTPTIFFTAYLCTNKSERPTVSCQNKLNDLQ